MPKQINIKIENVNLKAELNDSKEAEELLDLLPVTIKMSRWGDEYYGSCGLLQGLGRDAKEIMEIGEIAVWPTGRALCFFFGPTPASTDEKPKAASDVNPVGKILDGPETLRKFGHSITAEITSAE
jgi:hypothetical protein